MSRYFLPKPKYTFVDILLLAWASAACLATAAFAILILAASLHVEVAVNRIDGRLGAVGVQLAESQDAREEILDIFSPNHRAIKGGKR